MNRIVKTLHQQLEIASSGKWADDRIFIFVDFHGTVMKANYEKDIIEMYPGALEMLQLFTSWNRIVLVAWTCSYPDEINHYIKYLSDQGIVFDMINDSSQANSRRGCFDQKPYYSVLLDDKAVLPEEDIPAIINYIKQINK